MPALLIPIFTIIGTLTLGKIKWGNVSLVDPDKVTLVALALEHYLHSLRRCVLQNRK